jgi:hypothetical protein
VNVVRIGDEKDLATFVLSTISDNVPAGDERVDIYSYLVNEFRLLDLDDNLYDVDPFDDDLRLVLEREGYADGGDDDSEEE